LNEKSEFGLKPFQNISNLIISPTNRGSGCQRRKDLMTYTKGYGILAQLCPEEEEGQQQQQEEEEEELSIVSNSRRDKAISKFTTSASTQADS
jgi:hypothetical protein